MQVYEVCVCVCVTMCLCSSVRLTLCASFFLRVLQRKTFGGKGGGGVPGKEREFISFVFCVFFFLFERLFLAVVLCSLFKERP